MLVLFDADADGLRGEVLVPGDKSLSHRAVLFASMAEGESVLYGVLRSEDVLATMRACGELGAAIEEVADSAGQPSYVRVVGWGPSGPHSAGEPIDCGNSGTTARLLMGVLAGWPGLTATLTGDESLSARPMLRVTTPLSQMGASFDTAEKGTLPVVVRGAHLNPLTYDSPVASAQVKTAVLLAGLRARGRTTVREPAPSRDHTERLLPLFGVRVGRDESQHAAWVEGVAQLSAATFSVPRDPSSAAFPVVAAALVPGSALSIPGVALNLTRTAFVSVLERMGASIEIAEVSSAGEEPVGTLRVGYTPDLTATVVTAAEVPSLVDEVPILALAATQARGTTRFEGVRELRVKESDRLDAIAIALSELGVSVRAGEDWLEVDGPAVLGGAVLDSLGDHRLAMTWAVAGMVSPDEVIVDGFEAVAVSWPDFADDMRAIGAYASVVVDGGDLGGAEPDA